MEKVGNDDGILGPALFGLDMKNNLLIFDVRIKTCLQFILPSAFRVERVPDKGRRTVLDLACDQNNVKPDVSGPPLFA